MLEVVFQMQTLVDNLPLNSSDVRRCAWHKIIDSNRRDECLPLKSIDVRRCPWYKMIEPNRCDECLPVNS